MGFRDLLFQGRAVGETGLCAFVATGVIFNLALAVNGEDGAKRQETVLSAHREAAERVAALTAEHALLEERAHRMSGEALDTDFLEERVRSVLGLVHPDEYLVRMKDVDRLATQPQASLRLREEQAEGPGEVPA